MGPLCEYGRHTWVYLGATRTWNTGIYVTKKRAIGCHSIVGDGTVDRREDTVQMVALSKQSVRIVHGPINVLGSSQIGFSATISRLSGTETECRVALTVGERRADLRACLIW